MPSFKDKSGNTRFSMNPQVGGAMFGKKDSDVPGMDALDDSGSGGEDDHVELHHGGNPEGDPPPTDMTKYHTIHGMEVKNHDDYDSADAHMKDCMGESDGMMDDSGGEPTPPGDSATYA